MKISKLIIYPVKSLGPVFLESSVVETEGLKYDRKYALIKADTKEVLTQRKYPMLSQFSLELFPECFKVTYNNENIKLPLHIENGEELEINVWDDTVQVTKSPDELNKWFSDKLGFLVYLVYQKIKQKRYIDPDFRIKDTDSTSLADAFPILILSEESVQEINKHLENEIDFLRFRPNILVSGGKAFEEDKLLNFKVARVGLKAVKPCARCIMVNVDSENWQIKNDEPLKSLSTFRKFGNKIWVGMNVIPTSFGEISIGSEIKIH